jgi:hypothetical protein
MLLSFEKRFVPHVEDGSKTHTIRAERKRAPKVGETCHCYTGLRHKSARLLGRWPCVKVERITVTPHELRIDGEVLSRDERDAFRAPRRLPWPAAVGRDDGLLGARQAGCRRMAFRRLRDPLALHGRDRPQRGVTAANERALRPFARSIDARE